MRWSPFGLVPWALLTWRSPAVRSARHPVRRLGDSVYRYPVEYEPVQTEQFKRRGWYAFDSTRTAVTLDYKRGRPSGVQDLLSDGKPLVFAVYGWEQPARGLDGVR